MPDMAAFVYALNGDFPALCKRCIATLGNFDGVHLGHQTLLAETIARARKAGAPAVALTFDPPPARVLRPEVHQLLLTPLTRRVELLHGYGIDHVVVLRASLELLNLEAEDFFQRILVKGLEVRGLVEGYNFQFGKGRRGTVESLAALGQSARIDVALMPPQDFHGGVVSSSRIRTDLLAGNVDDVARMLGRVYRLWGMVGAGQRRGRTLGFPTANLESPENLVPGNGVYAVRVLHEGRDWLGAANVGPNPTFSETTRKVEVHLLDFAGDLYGQSLAVDFVRKLRDLRGFASSAELVAQIQADVAAVRGFA